MSVGIIDYGVGNIGSVKRTLEEVGANAFIASDPKMLNDASHIILPGVGGFSEAMTRLENGGWIDPLKTLALDEKIPLLGICLGMQLLATTGEEGGNFMGLGLIPGNVTRLNNIGCQLKIPHVGWNSINLTQINHPMFEKIYDRTDFYFVHSFVFSPINKNHLLATTEYGINFAAAVGKERIWGTQFHPEKSSKAGFFILKNFIDFVSC